ncbi:hypothetical protein pb186bvf_009006 [Paramecium bursaria]
MDQEDYTICKFCKAPVMNQEIDNHLFQCGDMLQEQTCQMCNETFIAQYMEEHQSSCSILQSQVLHQYVTCEFCNEQIIGLFKSNHYEECGPRQVVLYYQKMNQAIIECSICLDNLLPTDQKGTLPCCHIFHENCLNDWLKKKPECPTCRNNIQM